MRAIAFLERITYNRKFAIGKQRLGIMIETNDRILPVGIQSFEKIRKDGYLYVDKTDIIWQLANRGKKRIIT